MAQPTDGALQERLDTSEGRIAIGDSIQLLVCNLASLSTTHCIIAIAIINEQLGHAVAYTLDVHSYLLAAHAGWDGGPQVEALLVKSAGP
jgi:hypothetical protein